jgi:hypothetical protein
MTLNGHWNRVSSICLSRQLQPCSELQIPGERRLTKGDPVPQKIDIYNKSVEEITSDDYDNGAACYGTECIKVKYVCIGWPERNIAQGNTGCSYPSPERLAGDT